MKKIRSNEYLQFALRFTEEENALKNIFEAWLPKEIIDCHTHTGLLQCIGELENDVYYRPFCSFLDFNLINSDQIKKLFYPNKKVLRLRFANPFKGLNIRRLNSYLIENCPPEDRIALCGLPDDIEYTISMLSNSRISALKMYYYSLSPPATKIYQFFPKEILEETQARELPIILHLPGTLPQCLNQLRILLDDFPKLKIVLAHLGIYACPIGELREAYKIIGAFDRIFLDTAMVFSSRAIKAALDCLGEERILYGSDEPLNLLRVRLYKHPELGFRMISNYPYHWLSEEDRIRFGYLAKNATHSHWQILLAIKRSISKIADSKQATIKNRIFFKNSKNLFSF
jgi:hypothetical protein